ncbi:MAG: hypothetical protein KIT23_04330 [Sphingopyxis sp.]|nr:hypothetical protein [Sphingopyxis sp.]
MSDIVKHVIAPDGQTRVTFYRRSDGGFEFTQDKLYVDDLPEYDHRIKYWVPGLSSGIFDSAETAIREASVEYPWVFNGNDERHS